jgi:hypothetical protein
MAQTLDPTDVSEISTDYLVVGAGFAGLGFVDELLSQTSATITLVDKRDAPGGHWNDAYPFVRLHGPANLYGVESKALSDLTIEQHGPNKGLLTLSSGPEILAYCSSVLKDRLLASGRVTYFPSTEYVPSEGVLRGVYSKRQWTVQVKKKLVDARYCENVIPLTHTRSFSTTQAVNCIAPNELPRQAPNFHNFAVLGAGKTGVDTCIWLLTNGVDPDHIRWIIPHDYWYLNRAQAQLAMPFFDQVTTAALERFEALAEATDVYDYVRRLEACGVWVRLDRGVETPNFHSAVVSEGEVIELRKIKDVVRKGYVSAINSNEIVLTNGTIPAKPKTLYIDCTACAFRGRPDIPIFEPNKITLQLVRSALPGLSVALIAFIESLGLPIDECNDLVEPVPYNKTIEEHMIELSIDLRNRYMLSQNPHTRRWIANARLDAFSRLVASVPKEDTAKREKLGKIAKILPAAALNAAKMADAESQKLQSRL